MVNLIIPKSAAAVRLNAKLAAVPKVTVGDDKLMTLADEIAAPIPVGHPKAIWYRVVLTPIGLPKQSRGGLILSEKLATDMLWAHGLFKVIDVGSTAFQGPTWEHCDPAEIPKPGTLVLANPKTPARVQRNGQWFFIVNDDAIQSIVDPKHADNYVFLEGVAIG